EGLYDVETGKVDQQAIKNVVREAMPNLISQEGLDSSAFWWGNIHLNTDNVHVHFGLAEKKSARERFFYEPRGRWEYRGNFSQKTIKQLKSQVLNGLLNEQTKEQHLRQEQILANLKTNLIRDVFKPEKITQSAEKNFLEQA
ncbi:relaxase MobL, partial [Streptococcus sobrinus]|uniref:relaxase MobL n=1 Tax=Streptococcus sobrinus TaxID=1310 RepID=UPI000516F871